MSEKGVDGLYGCGLKVVRVCLETWQISKWSKHGFFINKKKWEQFGQVQKVRMT